MPSTAFRIVIIGGGVSGAVILLRLADQAGANVEIDVVEPRPLVGAGLAYSAADGRHRVNVPSTRMILDRDDPEHFHRWFIARGEDAADPDAAVDGQFYPQRSAFGRYMDERFRDLLDRLGPARLRHHPTRAMAAERHGAGYAVRLETGDTLTADALVLCTGNPPPELPAVLAPLAGDPRAVVDPWAPDASAAIGTDDRVLIVGTGLSMGDAVATLDARGHAGPILALSRHGLVPRPRPVAPREAWGSFADAASAPLSALLRRVRAAARAAAKQDRPWTDVLEAVRVDNGALWAALSLDERRRFNRHLRPYWDVHRFQAAPQIDGLVRAKQRDGRLRIVAASLVHTAPKPDGLQVGFRRRGTNAVTEERFDAVINCTGAGHAGALRRNPVLASLADAGIIRPDALGLGIAVDGTGRVEGEAGALFVVGPPTRGALGEVVGASEVSGHARVVADRLAALAIRNPIAHTRHTVLEAS